MASGHDKKKGGKQKEPAKAGSAQPPKPPRGVTSGVGVSETWIRVFEQNEQCDEQDRLTDQQISEFMKSEFPDLDALAFGDVLGLHRVGAGVVGDVQHRLQRQHGLA